MTIKERTYKERDNDDKKGKKKYIERVAEDREANQQIKDFLEGREDEDKPNESGASRLFRE